jgi:hypothetical protein
LPPPYSPILHADAEEGDEDDEDDANILEENDESISGPPLDLAEELENTTFPSFDYHCRDVGELLGLCDYIARA